MREYWYYSSIARVVDDKTDELATPDEVRRFKNEAEARAHLNTKPQEWVFIHHPKKKK